MPHGQVHDDGDEGMMRGQRIGLIAPIDHESGKASTTKSDFLPFNNGRFGNQRFYRTNDFVKYNLRKSLKGFKCADVIDYYP